MPDKAWPIPKIGRTTHFIDGSWAPTDGPTFPDRNPYNGAIVAEISAGGRAESERAVAAAAAAL